MKILIVSQYYYPDPFRLNEAAEGLVERGYRVTVLTGTPNYVTDDKVSKADRLAHSYVHGVEVYRTKTSRRKKGPLSLGLSYVTYVLSASLKALVLKKDFDVILIYQLSPVLMSIPAFLLRKISHKKIALYCLDLWPESVIEFGVTHKSLLYKLMRKFSIKTYNSVDVLSYTSISFEKYFRSDLKLSQKHYQYIPQFAEDIYGTIESKKHRGINYVFAGNIGEAQSVETIIKAAQIVHNRQIKWHIVGDGRKLEACKKLSEKLNVTNKVIFYGRRPLSDMPKFYAIADAMIVTLSSNPVISYTLPGKVQSYMAAGKPILASAMGETAEVIKKARCGMCCEAEDSISFAKIADIMAETDRSIMGFNSKSYYLDNFTKNIYLSNLEKMIRSIC